MGVIKMLRINTVHSISKLLFSTIPCESSGFTFAAASGYG